MAEIMVRYDDLRRYCEENHCGSVQLEYIKQMFTIEAKPVRYGEWIIKPHGTYRQLRAYCSYCGKHSGIGGIVSNQLKPYCPNCGAEMEVKKMRIIDADSLELDTEWSEYYDGYTAYSQFQIDEAPTIDLSDGWIKCRDLMPEDRTDVLFVVNTVIGDVYKHPYREVMKGHYISGRVSFWFSDDGRAIHEDKVTHWMPMPHLPKED